MQRKVILSSIISLLIITLLFFYVLTTLKRDINNEKNRSKKYLAASVETSLDLIQDNLFYIYKELSNKSRASMDINFNTDQDVIDFFLEENVLLHDFPNIISQGVSIDVINYNANEIIYINNFKGYMHFPISDIQNNRYPRAIKFNFDLHEIINNYLLKLIKNNMEYKYNLNSDIVLRIDSGANLLEEKDIYNSDLIIDLNKIFDTSKINDYFINRLKRETIFGTNDYLISNHTYLVVNSYYVYLTKLYQVRYNYYVLGLTIVYIILIGAMNVLFYTFYKIHQNTKREKDFTSLISHELKTPLSVIQLGADNLAAGVIDEKNDVIYYGDMIKKETIELKNMIDKILTISSSSNSERYNKFENVKIDKILSDIEHQCKNLSKQTDVKLVINNELKDNSIFCNCITLTGALFNIVQNSIRYGAAFSDDRTVYIEVFERRRRYKKGIVFKVKDHGPGMSWKDSRNIFKPFYRGYKMKELQLSGTGLGLSLTKKIVANHKGHVDVLLKLRKETVFEMWIPRRNEL